VEILVVLVIMGLLISVVATDGAQPRR